MFPQVAADIVQAFSQLGVEEVVMSPGSRNAPLSLAFARHSAFRTHLVVDERSAAFYAVGKIIAIRKPVVICSTSGSAVANYFPAVTESYFQQLPLIILTADRPPEWIDQEDGQTIFQQGIFGRHVKASFQVPEQTDHPDAHRHSIRLISEALYTATSGAPGPVHINIPFREPFYPDSEEQLIFEHQRTWTSIKPAITISTDTYDVLKHRVSDFGKVLLVAGQLPYSESLVKILKQRGNIVLVADKTANLHECDPIELHDLYLDNSNQELQPDLLITFGLSILSKKLKHFLRANRPKEHWHLSPTGKPVDTFNSLSQVIPAGPEDFFSTLRLSSSEVFREAWQLNESRSRKMVDSIPDQFGEFSVVRDLMKRISPGDKLIAANSLPVRYLRFFSIAEGAEIYANRGTSGIDGIVSTAIGIASSSSKNTWLLTGDLSFLYDSNALWKEELPANLRIIIVNNSGGGIFRMLPDARHQPEVERLLATRHNRNARWIARDYGIPYFACNSSEELESAFNEEAGKLTIIEVFTNPEYDQKVFVELHQKLKND